MQKTLKLLALTQLIIIKNMEDTQAGKILDNMVEFIKNHGVEQAAEIRRKADEEYDISKCV